MNYTKKEIEFIIAELKIELNGHLDGSEKNLIAENCPYCNKKHKFAVYVGKPTIKKPLFASNCFSCGSSNRDLNSLLEKLGRLDLVFESTTQIESDLEVKNLLLGDDGDSDIDDSLQIIQLPEGYKRCYKNKYLKSRGFTPDDYYYFPVGTTRGCNFKMDDYVILEIIDEGDVVGYVARHTWAKKDIEKHNREAKRTGKFRLMRYKNSTDNDFVKLLYNYDSVIDGETDTVIICEGAFDVIALTRKMELYDNKHIVPIATFGKKISNIQIYKLQNKGVKTVVLAYDGDAVDTIKNTAQQLKPYFNVYIADIEGELDFDEMTFDEIYNTFSNRLKTPIEYSLNKL